MTKDWLEWHRYYDRPHSSIAHRLTVVQSYLRRALTEAPRDEIGVLRLISMCAGEGRDVLPVLAEQADGHRVRAILVELDEIMSQRAREAVANLGLSGVEVKVADAGTTDTYRDIPPAHVLLVCSVFGNITVPDMRRTIAILPTLLAPGGIVIWTRSGHETSLEVRSRFLDHSFTEMSFTSTSDETLFTTTSDDEVFWIGMHRLADLAADVRPSQPGSRMFTFS